MRARRKLSGQQVTTIHEFELYTYDSDPDNPGGVKIGATRINGSPGAPEDFDVQKGGETVTIPGSEVGVDPLADYWLTYRKGDATIAAHLVAATARDDLLDWDLIFFAGPNADDSLRSAEDVEDGSGDDSQTFDTGSESPSGGGTLK